MKLKKLIVAVSTTVMLGSAGAVLAGDHNKASICHNGGTYNEDTQLEDPISFVITIAGRNIAKAVEKHVDNHADLETYQVLGLELECELLEDLTVECNEVVLCGPEI